MTTDITDIKRYLPKSLRGVYAGPDRRKSKRISIQALNEFGAEALRKRLPEIQRREDRRPTIVKVLDVLDLPRNAIANIIGSLAGVDKSKKERATLGLKRVWASDVLKKLGVKNRVVRAVGGFAVDVLLDPLTYGSLGATTGTKIAQHLPRVLKGGTQLVQTAAKSGRYLPELVKALGGGKRTARIMKAARAVAARTGPEAVAKRLAAKRGGLLYRQIVKGAQRGKPGALQFFGKYGEKGRSLFRLPFAAKGAPVLKVGAKARKFQAVKKAIKDPTAFMELAAKQKALNVRRGVLGVKAVALGKKQKAAQEAADVVAKLQAGPKTSGLSAVPRVTAAIRAQMQTVKAGQAVTAAKRPVARAAKKIIPAKEELARFATSPDAPKIIQEKMRAMMGPRYLRGAPGVINRIRELKQAMFGHGRSEVHQGIVAARTRHDIHSLFRATKAQSGLAKTLDPIADRLAQSPAVRQLIGGPDDVKRYIFTLAEAGPAGRSLGQYGSRGQDVIHEMYQTAQKAGLLDDAPLQAALRKYSDDVAEIAAQAKKRGISLGDIEDYALRTPTKEAKPYVGMQKARIVRHPGQQLPGGRMSTHQPAHIGRTKMLTFTSPQGPPVDVLSTNTDEIGDLMKRGYEKAGSRSISTAQWNKIARETGKPAGVIGPKFPGMERFSGKLFEEDLPTTFGRRVSQSERAQAAAQVSDIVKPYGVSATQEVGEKSQAFAHMVKPKKPMGADSPFAAMAKAGTLDKYYPVPIADQLDELVKKWDDVPAIQSLLGASDKVLGFWKAAQLYHPAYVLRNVFQNFFGGLMAGANPLEVARMTFAPQTFALRRAIQAGNPALARGHFFKLAGRDVPAEQLFHTGRNMNMVGAGRAASEGALLRKVKDRTVGLVFRGNTLMEDHQRLATWFHFMDRGMDARSAAIRVQVAMPDLTDLGHWDKNVFKRLFPFWSWMRRNGALQIMHHLPRKPAYAAMLPKLKNFGEAFMVKDSVPDAFRPAWMREQMAVQVTGDREGGQTFLPMNWLPFEDLYQVMSLTVAPGEAARRGVASMRPGIRMPVELATGVNVFKQTPYERGTEVTTAELLKAFPQALMGKSGTPMDTLVTLRPLREWLPGGRVSEMPTAGTKVTRAFLGGAFQPVSLERGKRAEVARLRQLAMLIRRKINYAKSANDEAEAQQLMRQWVRTMKRLHEIGGEGVAKSTQEVMSQAGVPAGMAG